MRRSVGQRIDQRFDAVLRSYRTSHRRDDTHQNHHMRSRSLAEIAHHECERSIGVSREIVHASPPRHFEEKKSSPERDFSSIAFGNAAQDPQKSPQCAATSLQRPPRLSAGVSWHHQDDNVEEVRTSGEPRKGENVPDPEPVPSVGFLSAFENMTKTLPRQSERRLLYAHRAGCSVDGGCPAETVWRH